MYFTCIKRRKIYNFLTAQTPFAEPFDAIMKSWVMMLGEFEFTSLMFDEEAPPPYNAMTYVIFIIFLVLMGIILSNLLVGLAVDDVNQLRFNARLVKLRMQVCDSAALTREQA